MLRFNADLLVGQVNVELHSCRKKQTGMWEGKAGPFHSLEQRSASLIIPVTPGFSPGAREQQALSGLGAVSMAGSAAGSSLCVRSFGNGA